MIALLLACGTRPIPVEDEAPVEVRTWLVGKPGTGGGTLVLQEEHASGLDVDVVLPASENGLEFTPKGEARVEHLGDRIVTTRELAFSGPPGHHVVPPVEATWPNGSAQAKAASEPLYIDLGVPPATEGKLADIDEPSPIWTIPWRAALVVGALTGLMVAGAVVAFGNLRRRPAPVAPARAPDVIALEAWDRVRKDATLDDHAKAVELSRIFREYVEAVLRFPATKWTTTETLDQLRAMPHLPEGNVPRAKGLLRATDRVKYAGEDPAHDVFEELDADLRAFVGSTRPRAWGDAPALQEAT